jgi:predicted RNase H-like nuclease
MRISPAPVARQPQPQRWIGIDGCKSGWFAFELRNGAYRFDCYADLRELFVTLDWRSRVFIDMPIGLQGNGPSGRDCDRGARAVLGPRRASVFATPSRAALNASDYAQACSLNRTAVGKALSLQAFAILPKIRALDVLMCEFPIAKEVVFEAHPEVCFWALAGAQPMSGHKRNAAGFAERMAVLAQAWPQAGAMYASAAQWAKGRGVARDDIVDALVNAIAATALTHDLREFPEVAQFDELGLPMRMAYAVQANLAVSGTRRCAAQTGIAQ